MRERGIFYGAFRHARYDAGQPWPPDHRLFAAFGRDRCILAVGVEI